MSVKDFWNKCVFKCRQKIHTQYASWISSGKEL